MDKINNLVEFTKVSKKLGNKQVLNDINLTVASGEVVGIVGPNGCGKTTLLRLVTGLIYPDRGEVRVSGRAVRLGLIGELPASVGALIESPAFLPQLSGLKNLTILADIQQKINEQAVREAIKRVGLDPDNRKPVKSYSLGMRQRLGIAQAIMKKPNILLFDEPTNGLDQEGKILFFRDYERAGGAGSSCNDGIAQ
ncbi:ABC transporter ATP-binding protein [Thermoactinomyces sp. CICC 10523]|jgi:ABC-2 type transport system ATP-binding protein|uniref:ABC transporter ATP-binding protein n=1 Tax=Thermoactinomyces sp. CICC 10523 TaxID=2767428 RepID=UPI001E3EDB7B|nr:ABC transporter ATP-binding protein [Thermoactinomyces sp. CICC 10523]